MEPSHEPAPGILALLQRLVATGTGALQNRLELFAVEWQEERVRLMELAVWGSCILFLGTMTLVLLTGVIIFAVPESARLYVAAGFLLLYLAGTVMAWFSVKSLLKHGPFVESINQVKKDRLWVESLK